jgi:hypothetical protein
VEQAFCERCCSGNSVFAEELRFSELQSLYVDLNKCQAAGRRKRKKGKERAIPEGSIAEMKSKRRDVRVATKRRTETGGDDFSDRG